MVPATWLRKPSSLYCGTNSMPDLPSLRERMTSAALLPIDETTPKPVTTTRLILPSRRRRGRVLEQPDPQVIDLVGGGVIGMHHAVGDTHDQPAQDHPLEVHVISELLDCRHDHAGEFDIAHAQRAAAARRFHPAKEEAQQLPQPVEAQAPRHD